MKRLSSEIQFDNAFLDDLSTIMVQVDIPDENTVVLKNVPTNECYFNKPHSNVLMRRYSEGAPFLVCVDDDLEYTGDDRELLAAFARGHKQSGWKTITLGSRFREPQEVAREALRILGADGNEPGMALGRASTEESSSLLSVYGANLSRQLTDEGRCCIGRQQEVDEIASGIIRCAPAPMLVVVGESGVGKSEAVYAAACRVAACRPEIEVISVDLGSLFGGSLFGAERESLFGRLMDEASNQSDIVLALEHIDLLVSDTSYGVPMLTKALDSGMKIIGITLPGFAHLLTKVPGLSRRIVRVDIPEADESDTLAILLGLKPLVLKHYGLDVEDGSLRACLKAALPLPGYLPSKAIDLLHRSASRAVLNNAEVLGLDDIYSAANMV